LYSVYFVSRQIPVHCVGMSCRQMTLTTKNTVNRRFDVYSLQPIMYLIVSDREVSNHTACSQLQKYTARQSTLLLNILN